VYNNIKQVLAQDKVGEEIWVIGGSEIYQELLPYAYTVIIT
jgi:dihydrofolate reductase